MISGTGANGRVTKKDLQNYISSNASSIYEPIKSSASKPEFLEVNQDGEKVKIPVFGTDCFAYGLLLSGKVDLIVEANMKPWDYMAQTFLIKEFGGCISDWNGNELNLDSNGKVVASYDSNHHKTILGLLNEIK